jgi:hypothetical protein
MTGGGPTVPMPKATVKLQPTQAMQRPSISAPPSAPVKRSAAADAEQFYEEKDPEAGLVPLSVICFVLSVLLMGIQMLGADKITDESKGVLFFPFDKVPPAAKQQWEDQDPNTKIWNNRKFASSLLAIP